MSTRDLRQISIDLIRRWQHQSGAYVASPTFSQYGYSWLRDGAWIAYAMDKVGQHDSADAFYRWGIRVLTAHEAHVDSLLAKLQQGIAPDETDYLPTRFTVGGEIGKDEWTEFQLDGYGAWLWGLADHCQTADAALWQEARQAIQIMVRYLAALWQSPNYDCWEEHREQIHTSTLAAIYGGLRAVQRLDPALVPADLPSQIRDYVLEHCVTTGGHFCKFIANDAVDASLLWVAVPYRLVEVDDPRFCATFDKIVRDLHVPDGGVHRFRVDNYYGGGEWLLLTAWLGWTYLEMGQRERAIPLLHWIEAQADADDQMPEQVEHHLLLPDYLQHWIAKWGTSAKPLLWSHAMYLVLDSLLND
ncbi:MAG: glycoside hydrolase family 15 protein [Anaerolineae bacterium]|nr:glycoside hydrolase family 15 protein [Anaerolineae bacterium]